jgi:zinc transporter 1/2/3
MAEQFDPSSCLPGRQDEYEGPIGLRIGAIFIIGATSLAATLFPVVTRRVPKMNVPAAVFDFAKYFGSGVIIATAFIHLLSPGAEELGSPCLNEHFQNYPFAFAFSMIAMFFTFVVELLSFRIGAGLAQKLAYDPNMGGHHHATEHAIPHGGAAVSHTDNKDNNEGSEIEESNAAVSNKLTSLEEGGEKQQLSAAASEILGVAILEFGVIFHSVIIGITLGTIGDYKDFTTLFIVIIFHQSFEGLGLGSRLALLPLARSSFIPWIGGLAYSVVTPIGIAIGLGVRSSYNGDSAKANYITGTFDSVSSGVLLYTGLVELLAHEFIFNHKMRTAPLGKVLLNIFEVLLGAGLMALLGYWA